MYVELQYNGQGNLIVGKRTVQAGQTFFVDSAEIADTIPPSMIQTGLITYVNNAGLPAGTIDAAEVMMQPQVAISAGDVQDAMVQISNFMATSSGTIFNLGQTVNTFTQQVQVNQQSINVLQTNLNTVATQQQADEVNIGTLQTNYNALTTQVATQAALLNTTQAALPSLATLAYATGTSIVAGSAATVITHNLNTLSYWVSLTPTSNPAGATFWVDKGLDILVINGLNLPSGTVTLDLTLLT